MDVRLVSGSDRLRRGSRRLLGLAVVLVLGTIVGAEPSAARQPPGAPIAVSSGPYELKEKDDDHQLTVTVTNPSGSPVEVELVPAEVDRGCEIGASPDEVAPRRSTAITFTLKNGCEIGEESTGLVLTVSGRGINETVEIVASTPEESDPKYAALLWYGLGLILALLLAWTIFDGWFAGNLAPEVPSTLPSRARGEHPLDHLIRVLQVMFTPPPARSFWAPLPSLTKDWSFKDSWASNVGLGAALFTALLGASDLLEKILGEDSDDVISLAVVSATISATLIAAAPLALVVFKRPNQPDSARVHNTAGGVLVASAIVLVASIGQIAVMGAVLWDTSSLGGDTAGRALVVGVAIVAIVVLGVYALQSVPLTLTSGIQKPAKERTEVDAIDGVAEAIALAAKEFTAAPAAPAQAGPVVAGGPPPVPAPPGPSELDQLLYGIALRTSSGDDPVGPKREFAAML